MPEMPESISLVTIAELMMVVLLLWPLRRFDKGGRLCNSIHSVICVSLGCIAARMAVAAGSSAVVSEGNTLAQMKRNIHKHPPKTTTIKSTEN